MPEWVITNTSPIIALLKAGQLHLLDKMYPKIAVPEAVWREIEQGISKQHYLDLQKVEWISIKPVRNKAAVEFLLTDLDAGEAEVIVLAKEIETSLVVIDEKLGRRIAAMQGLTVTGTLGVLLKAKKQGLLPLVQPSLEIMQQEGIWLSEAMVRLILKQANEL